MAYSLTGEGWDESASAVSLRGLDAAVYYRAKGVLNCGHANVRSLIMHSLKHWRREYQVDGFCFLHAETLNLGWSPPTPHPSARALPSRVQILQTLT